ncbi:hypothetical protein ABEW34_20750 [Paenibacillus algorifonticola]|uniref:RCC1 domain-containing protein n=1 Tax=Paenibacillus algorifonticola TaxID=684063 RepID=UPI003D2822A8
MTSDNKYTVENLSVSTSYNFAIRAKDAAGNYSELSEKIAVDTKNLMLSAGGNQSFVLKETDDGTIWRWGANSSGQLGDGTIEPVLTAAFLQNFNEIIEMSSGQHHTLALKRDGRVWTWGANTNGQLGDGTNQGKLAPSLLPQLDGIVAVSAGGYHSLALKGDGTVWSWGYNAHGQLGNGTTTNQLTPVGVSGLNGVIDVAAGEIGSAALKSDGTVWSWGYNGSNQLGDGTTITRSTPGQVVSLTKVTALAVGTVHSLAQKEDGSIWSWGANENGQLGDGSVTNRTTPVQVKENAAPEVRLTSPIGTQAIPTEFNINSPSIGWYQTDAPLTKFSAFQVRVLDESGEILVDSGTINQNNTMNSSNWTVNVALPTFRKLQVSVRVKDSILWSDWSTKGWMIIK